MVRCQYFVLVVLAVLVRQSVAQIDEDQDNSIIELFHTCKCVRYYQCNEDGFIITDGSTLISERIQEDKIKCKGGKFEGDFVCCKEKNETVNIKSPEDPPKVVCGKQKPAITERIFGDDESELVPVAGEFPWIAAIFKKNDAGRYVFYSSGSLIHPKVILTANHYVHGKKSEDFKVVVNGEIDLPVIGNNTSEERNVIEIVHHEEFYQAALYYDVALLILDKPYVEGVKFLNRICLPPEDVNMERMRCMVAGWGKENIENAGPKILKKVQVPFVEHSKCQSLLRKTRLGTRFNLHKTFVCAGGEKDKDACEGDGGSPLMCPFPGEGGRYFQAGIVAWGIDCGLEDVPGVYGSVKKFEKWIINELNKRGLSDGVQ